jgi:glutathione S-transferase
VNRTVDVATSWAASILELGAGFRVAGSAREPQKPLELYEFEQCPFCRKVREAMSELDLSPIVYPCPPGGSRFRPRAQELGGKAQFPFLVDPNEGQRLYESTDIVRYLARTYGDGTVPLHLRFGALTTVRAAVASLPRGRQRVAPSRAPEKPLELWSFEASPYCRIARDALCRLELPYRLHNVAKGSRHRSDFVARSGKMMVPYLADPNTGREMFESADIVRYLESTYGA